MTPVDLSRAVWRKSSRSGGANGGGTECVEAAALGEGRIAVRDSKQPGGTVLLLPQAGMAAWLRSVKTGKFDS